MSTDSVTWPAEFSDLKRLDGLLKCGICYEYMTNCMITSCSHNYCSLCIRRFLHYKNQCPTCFEEIYEVNLRNNRPLDEVILIYVNLREKLLRALRLASTYLPKSVIDAEASLVSTTIQSEKKPSVVQHFKDEPLVKEEKKKLKIGEDVVVYGVKKIPGIFGMPPSCFPKPKQPFQLATCPVCQVDIPTKNINIHLDSCLALDDETKPKKPTGAKRSPLPKRLYHLIPDKALRKILKDYGLNTLGDRKSLISRIQRFTVLYNAENDSPNPRSVSQLIQQVEREEREEKKPRIVIKALTSPVHRRSSPDKIEKANKAYCEENKESFNRLIESIRSREAAKKNQANQIENESSSNEELSLNRHSFNPDVPSTSKTHDEKNKSLYIDRNEKASLYCDLLTDSDHDSDPDLFGEAEIEEGKATDKECPANILPNTKSPNETKDSFQLQVDCTQVDKQLILAPINQQIKSDTDGDSDDSSLNSVFDTTKIRDGLSSSPAVRSSKRTKKRSTSKRKRPPKNGTPTPDKPCPVKKMYLSPKEIWESDENSDVNGENLNEEPGNENNFSLPTLDHTTVQQDYTTPRRTTRSHSRECNREIINRESSSPAIKMSTRKRLKRDLSPTF